MRPCAVHINVKRRMGKYSDEKYFMASSSSHVTEFFVCIHVPKRALLLCESSNTTHTVLNKYSTTMVYHHFHYPVLPPSVETRSNIGFNAGNRHLLCLPRIQPQDSSGTEGTHLKTVPSPLDVPKEQPIESAQPQGRHIAFKPTTGRLYGISRSISRSR
jgi:hypothetical protein